jgi:hypothetical protein
MPDIIIKQTVIDRIKPLFDKAVSERSGVSFLLSKPEQAVISQADIEQIKEETGYNAMLGQRPER